MTAITPNRGALPTPSSRNAKKKLSSILYDVKDNNSSEDFNNNETQTLQSASFRIDIPGFEHTLS